MPGYFPGFMKLRALIHAAVFLLCAAWPQGLVLCVGDGGHLGFKLEGTSYCSSESDDCDDCVDTPAPSLTGAPFAIRIAPAAVLRPDLAATRPAGSESLEEAALPAAHPPTEQRSVVLLI